MPWGRPVKPPSGGAADGAAARAAAPATTARRPRDKGPPRVRRPCLSPMRGEVTDRSLRSNRERRLSEFAFPQLVPKLRAADLAADGLRQLVDEVHQARV